MQDGRIGLIRSILEANGYSNTIILSYTAKYCSALYAPFRDALGSQKNLGGSNKKHYQQDFRNSNEALAEAELDINEGADILMVKPASYYLDIIYKIKNSYSIPLFAYQVSGEYSMICHLANNCNETKTKLFIESITAIKRAGADSILSYYAIELATLLQKNI